MQKGHAPNKMKDFICKAAQIVSGSESRMSDTEVRDTLPATFMQ